MDARVKVLWVQALTSGAYEQATEVLRRGDRYCCLGVLCDLYRLDTRDGEWMDPHVLDGVSTFELDGEDDEAGVSEEAELPWVVQRWAGLEGRGGSVVLDAMAPHADDSSLASMNDAGRSFAQLAEVIEAKL